ncbi:unnamed protein product [Darwinula stevensoni]|uniref:Death domain-containing protein n=1 Tax=Darwinula stevensoni TaxID=69355 RepID=A0A7R8X5F7_9CRUS|nr:unnamed protein product [Darwinula stevensoni]CAG0884738.1 unnamed protein product [Darwinula stevensoni]
MTGKPRVNRELSSQLKMDAFCPYVSVLENLPLFRVLQSKSGDKLAALIRNKLISVSKISGGHWENFADAVGLKHEEVMCIENMFKERPMSLELDQPGVILKWMAKKGKTMMDLLTALHGIQRADILRIIFPVVQDVIGEYRSLSDYDSMRPVECLENVAVANDKKIIAHGITCNSSPDVMTHESFTFEVGKDMEPDFASGMGDAYLQKWQKENVQERIPMVEAEKLGQKAFHKRRVVLITHADDGFEECLSVARFLRSQDPPISCLLIHELHVEQYMDADPVGCINKWFQQVDYIIPLITPGYVRIILLPQGTFLSPSEQVARRIYQLMDQDVLRKGRNSRVKPLVPPNSSHLQHTHSSIFCSPTFCNWRSTGKLENLVKLMTG